MLFFLKAFLMLLIPFYRVDFSDRDFPSEFTYIQYENGRDYSRVGISSGDKYHMVLKEILYSERNGWKYDFVTYAPNKIFKSSTMEINFTNDSVVVNYQNDGGDWIQISKKIDRVEDFWRLI